MKYTYNKEKHTKTLEDLWVMRLTSRTDRDEFNAIRTKVKTLGGWYSRVKKGFVFKTDVEEQLNDIFGDENIKHTSDNMSAGIEIPKGRIAKNSRFIPYIKKHIKSATVYHLGYDEPFPYHDNDETDTENVVHELDNKSYNYLWYQGNGNFTLYIHSNYHYDFTVEGVTDYIDRSDDGLQERLFYVPVTKKPKFGDCKINNDFTDYKVGDKVHFCEYGYEMSGTIVKDSSYETSITQWVMGEEDNKQYKTDKTYRFFIDAPKFGTKTDLSADRIILSDKPVKYPFTYAETPEKFGERGLLEHPYFVWEQLIGFVKNDAHYAKKAHAARKEANKLYYKDLQEKNKQRIEKAKRFWYDWELSSYDNFTFARLITGETEAEQKQRITLWHEKDKFPAPVYPKEKKEITVTEVKKEENNKTKLLQLVKQRRELRKKAEQGDKTAAKELLTLVKQRRKLRTMNNEQ